MVKQCSMAGRLPLQPPDVLVGAGLQVLLSPSDMLSAADHQMLLLCSA